ncbi:DUF4135 domain-containing protein [Knoellia sp. CPCC 206450]|uniref:DUF4135 domain-containing protein n=1 Tax=Knoellia tibetensis TaxID=3404798 RepID=UPI003B434FAA
MDRVTRSVLELNEQRIRSAVRSVPGVDRDVLVASVTSCVAQRLQTLLPRTFVVDFHRVRETWGLPADATSSRAMTRYLEDFGPDTVRGWQERWPVFGELLESVVDAAALHVEEIATRWVADHAAVVAHGVGTGSREVTRIEHLGSDAHQGGRTVAAVHLEDGSKVVYKPRDLGPEELTRRCLTIISEQVGLDLSRCAPLSLERGGYGWQRVAAPAPAEDERAVREHHVRFGAACALLTAIGATDMHHENVLAVGDHPLFLDLETVLHASVALTAQDLSMAVINRLKLSPANTLLLPQRLPSGPYSVLLGGLGVPYEQQSSRTDRILVNRDTDAVDLASRTYPFQHTDNVLRGPRGPVDPLDHVGDLRDGLRRGVAAIAACRDRLIDQLDETPIQVRHIVRSTAVYGRILDAATHPDNLGRREDFERVVTMLRAPVGINRRFVSSFVLDAERQALRRLDIPYFTIRSDDVRLRSEGATSAPAADLSPRDRAVHGLRAAGPEALPFDELLLEEGLAEIRSVRREREPGYAPVREGSWGEDLVPADGVDAVAILDRLLQVSVVVEGVDGRERGWVNGAFAPTIATFDPGTSSSFHDGGGILLPFERAARSGVPLPGGTDDLAAEVRRGVRGLVRVYRERLEGLPWSVASGLLSVDYVLGHERVALDLPEPSPAPEAMAALHPSDTMKGAPGAAALLSSFSHTPPEVLERLMAVMDSEAPDAPGAGPLDLAHGPLGLLWARHRLAVAVGDDVERSRVAGLLAARSHARDPAPRGWCHGHAGLILTAAEAGADEADLRWHAQKAAEPPTAGRPVDLSVCHGAAGVVQALVHVAAVLGDQWPVELASDHWQQVAKHAREDGYVTGDPSRQGLLGYFLGWSGVADTALLLASARAGAARLASPEWVPVAFASSASPRGRS